MKKVLKRDSHKLLTANLLALLYAKSILDISYRTLFIVREINNIKNSDKLHLKDELSTVVLTVHSSF